MKKEDITGLIVYVLILGLAIVFGITVLQTHFPNSDMDNGIYMLFILGAIVVGIILNAVIYELAHILGAKVGRYDIISVCILGLLWYKDNGKSAFKFSGYDGLTGETKILPKIDVKKEPNPTAYCLFGSLFYAIELIVIIVIFTVFTSDALSSVPLANIGYFLLVIAAIGGLILVYNILPFRLDAVTDGYRLTMVNNAANKKAFNELLRVENAISEGRSDVEIATFNEITNFTADLNLNKVYVLLGNKQFLEAEKLIDIILAGKNNISEKVYIRARAQKIYINIMTKSIEDAKTYYENEVPMSERRLLSNDLSMVSIRTYLLMSGMFDGSRSECNIAINNVNKCFKSTPKQRRKVETELFNDAIKKVHELHPSWGMDEYYIVYQEDDKKKK